jgi:hypothetical protein
MSWDHEVLEHYIVSAYGPQTPNRCGKTELGVIGHLIAVSDHVFLGKAPRVSHNHIECKTHQLRA